MKLLEYASRQVFERYGIPVKPGKLAYTPEEAEQVARDLEPPYVVKAQVPVGGRGKAGGIKLAQTPEEVREKAEKILNLTIKGVPVKKVFITTAVNIAKEYYVSVVIDRRNGTPVIMVSSEGGVDIEEVARTKPEAIHKLTVDPVWGLSDFQTRNLMFRLFKDKKKAIQAAGILKKLYRAFTEIEAQLAEINPLVETQDGEIVAVDAKILLDDNALFRHPDLEKLRDMDYEEQTELEAKEADLSYVKLQGTIGCCVNGAGLAMATMDVIKHFGGEPANFLDIGGSSRPEKVLKAMEIIASDPNVKAIFFNIFGGITRCDDVANGLVEAFRQMEIKVPIVIRLTGTNEELAREILEQSGLPLVTVKTMAEGAKKAIELAGA